MRTLCVPRSFRSVLIVGLTAIVTGTPAYAVEKSLARYVPKNDLLLFAEFAGLDAKAESWKKTSFYKMLNETTAGTMIESVFVQTIDGLLPGDQPGRPNGKQLLAAIERFGRSGFMFALNGKFGPAAPQVTLVIRDAGGADVGKGMRQLLALITKSAGPSELVQREDGRRVTFIKGDDRPNGRPPIAWWFEGEDFVLVLAGTESTVDATVARITGKAPSAEADPSHLELARTVDGFEPVMLSYVDLTGLPPTPPALGLSGLKSIDARWGFQGKELVGIMRVHAPSPRKGLLTLLDGPTFDKSTKLPIPAGVTDFTVMSFDGAKMFDQLVAIARRSDPNADAAVKNALDIFKGMTGVELREELLAQLGPKAAFYIEPQATTIPVSPYHSFVEWGMHPPKLTMLVQLKNEAKFAKTLDTLMDVVNRQIRAQMMNMPEGSDVSFQKLKGGDVGYVLNVPLATLPLPAGIRPTLMIKNGYLAFGISPAAARKSLAFEGKPAGPIDALPNGLRLLNVNDPSGMVPDLVANLPFMVQAVSMLGSDRGGPAIPRLRLQFDADSLPTVEQLKTYITPGSFSIVVNDGGIEIVSRDSVPSMNPVALGPVTVALMLPAVQSARTAARRAQSTNNIKQMMLAMHNFHDANGNFPAAAIADADGKPLLSWRVAILPYIEQAALYNEFHLDEAWDSPHNKTLIERMPAIYKSTNNQPADPFATYYQVFTGNGSLFDPKTKGVKINAITDGTSNTIAVVEAGNAVPWTKPDDIAFDPAKDVPKLGGPGFPGGFNAGFADGSVRFINFSIDPMVLKALITRAGGEVVNANDF